MRTLKLMTLGFRHDDEFMFDFSSQAGISPHFTQICHPIIIGSREGGNLVISIPAS